MNYYDRVHDLTLKEIEVFIEAADKGSFAKAGERYFMTQSMVSKCIASMENVIGLKLFERKSTGVFLTSAGRVLYQNWRTLPLAMADSIAAAYSMEESETMQFTVNDFGTIIKKEYLWKYVKQFHELYPKVEFILESFNPLKNLKRLETKNCDIAYAPDFEKKLYLQHGMEVRHIYKCSLCVWIHKSNPLYNRDSITVKDLENEEFITIVPSKLAYYEQMVVDLCESAGFYPKKLHKVADVSVATLYLKLGKGVVIRDELFDSADTDDIKIFKLPDTETGIIMAWRKDLTNKYALEFINLYAGDAEKKEN